MFDFAWLVLLVLPVLVIIAGMSDLTTMKIPNWINLSLFFSFYPVALIVGLDWAAIGLSSLIGLGILVAGMAMFALRWLGGGDAKLFAAAALWMGPNATLAFILCSALIGGLFCLILMQARAWFQVYATGLPGWGQRLMQPKGDVPYGVAIAMGALCAYPAADMVQKLVIG